MKFNSNITEKVYISLYLTSLTLVAIYMILTKQYSGEFSPFKHQVTTTELFLLLTYSFLGFIAAYFFYVITKDKKLHFSILPWRVNSLRLSIIFFWVLVAQFAFLVVTGVGRIGSQATSPYSPVFALLNIDPLFGIFYFLNKKSPQIGKYHFWLIVSTYVLFKLLQGWAGVLLVIFFFELYFYFKIRSFRPWSRAIIIALVPLFLILCGGKVYQYVFPYKFEIRGFGKYEIGYYEGVVNLTNRLTFFPVAVGAYERNDEIQRLALQDGTLLREIKGFFRPFAPRFLMKFKEYRSINNLVTQSFYPQNTETTSTDIGLMMYLSLIFSINFAEGILWVIFTTVLLIINKVLIDSFEQYRGQLNFIYFLLVMKLYYTSSIEMVFSYGSIGILFLLPLLFVTGAIKFKRCILC